MHRGVLWLSSSHRTNCSTYVFKTFQTAGMTRRNSDRNFKGVFKFILCSVQYSAECRRASSGIITSKMYNKNTQRGLLQNMCPNVWCSSTNCENHQCRINHKWHHDTLIQITHLCNFRLRRSRTVAIYHHIIRQPTLTYRICDCNHGNLFQVD